MDPNFIATLLAKVNQLQTDKAAADAATAAANTAQTALTNAQTAAAAANTAEAAADGVVNSDLTDLRAYIDANVPAQPPAA